MYKPTKGDGLQISKFIKISLIFMLSVDSAFADQIDVVENLSFGNIVVSDNSTKSTVTINKSGTTQVTGNMHVVQGGTAGEIQLSDFVPGVQLSIMAAATNDDLSGLGTSEKFTITNIDIASIVNIPASGQYTLLFGATLESSGSGAAYPDTEFSTVIQVFINY